MGTDAWRNWRVSNLGTPELENFDDELQSDALFTGGTVAFGPYRLSAVTADSFAAAVIVTSHIHTDLTRQAVVNGTLAKADSSAYHGGTMTDEIAALVSLELGVRLRVAGTRRISGLHQGDDSQPSMHLNVPRLADPSRSPEMLPQVQRRSADLGSLQRLAFFPSLNETDQTELVRAAQAYATGIWVANEDPNMAWLQLVTALEAAATRRQTSKVDAMDLIQEAWPEIWEALETSDAGTQKRVADRLAQQTRAGRRFQDFVVECTPPPPMPQPTFPLDWSPESLRQCAKVIYRHRSKALHEGRPFPMPMLQTPMVDAFGAIQEFPGGLNAAGLGGVWDASETPLYLSAFEHIARGALLHWWDELVRAAMSSLPGSWKDHGQGRGGPD